MWDPAVPAPVFDAGFYSGYGTESSTKHSRYQTKMKEGDEMPKKIADKNEICEHLTEFMRGDGYSESTRLGAAKELVKLVGYAADSPERSVTITDDRFRGAYRTVVS